MTDYATLAEAAEIIGAEDEATVYRLVRTGRLCGVRTSDRRWLVPRHLAEAFHEDEDQPPRDETSSGGE